MYTLNFCESRLPPPLPVVAMPEEASRPHRRDDRAVVVMRVSVEVPGGIAEPRRAPSPGVRQVSMRARLQRLRLGLCLMSLMPDRGVAPHHAAASVMTFWITKSDLEMWSEQRRRFRFLQASRTAPKEPQHGTRRVSGTSS